MAHNKIENIPSKLFHSLFQLKRLDLSNNKLVEIPETFFPFDNRLEYLSLENNHLKRIDQNSMENLRRLKTLILKKNHLRRIDQNSMKNLRHLKTLDISEMYDLYIKKWKFLLEMKELKRVETSVFSHCCFVKNERVDVNCVAPDDSFSDCDRMIKNNMLRYIVWVVFVGIFVGNLVALLLRIVYQDKSYIQNILIDNLHLGDFLMGVYVAVVVMRDLHWSGNYYIHDYEWRHSIECKSFGAIALISSEVCVLTLAVITYDRRSKLVHDVDYKPKKHRVIWFIIILIWVTSTAIAVVPAVVKNYFYDEENDQGFYGTNGLCLPLQLPGEKDPAWEYCLAVFGVFNFLVACYMAWAYCTIFYASYISVRDSGNVKGMKEEPKMAIRFCSIVFTDIFCWYPIAMLIYLSLAGIVSDTENTLYAWFSICVATINSAINPLIYTITTPLFWPRFIGWFEKISRCFGQCCNNEEHEDPPASIDSNPRIVCNVIEASGANEEETIVETIVDQPDISCPEDGKERPLIVARILQGGGASQSGVESYQTCKEREDRKEQHGEAQEFELTEIKEKGQEIRFGKRNPDDENRKDVY